ANLAKGDFEIFTSLAEYLGVWKDFSQGKSEMEWLRTLYEELNSELNERDLERKSVSFDEFWQRGFLELPIKNPDQWLFEEFRENPDEHPLSTPSGRIEIWSSTIDSFGYDDCPGHPMWMEPIEWLGAQDADHFPLHLIANQPK